ncbi:MAG: hypothetical protein IJ849_00925 [Selenomonadaceae bacterium]|nr:hypothetical protein [Selenomonadaceae bacterium]
MRRFVIVAGERDIPILTILSEAFHDLKLITAFILVTSFYRYTQGLWEDWYFTALIVNLMAIFYLFQRNILSESRLYNTVFDAVAREHPVAEDSMEERLDRLTSVLAAYQGLRRQQRIASQEKKFVYYTDLAVHIIVIGCTVQMIMAKLQ